MLFAVLEFVDFAIIAFLILAFAGSRAAASAYLRPAGGGQLKRMEHKLDLILTHFGIEYVPPPKSAWQELADAGQKISAIKAYRTQHGAGLLDAKNAVEEYMHGEGA
jgi:hypothetical protein